MSDLHQTYVGCPLDDRTARPRFPRTKLREERRVKGVEGTRRREQRKPRLIPSLSKLLQSQHRPVVTNIEKQGRPACGGNCLGTLPASRNPRSKRQLVIVAIGHRSQSKPQRNLTRFDAGYHQETCHMWTSVPLIRQLFIASIRRSYTG